MCMFVVWRRTLTPSTMLETWCLLHYPDRGAGLFNVKGLQLQNKGCFPKNVSLIMIPYHLWLFCVSVFCIYIRQSICYLIVDVDSEAPSSQGAPWILATSKVFVFYCYFFATKERVLQSPTLGVFCGLLGLLMWLGSQLSFSVRLKVLFCFTAIICYTTPAVTDK